jgi:uncharacterized protein YnzC (UPF0291/DUF896 family)
MSSLSEIAVREYRDTVIAELRHNVHMLNDLIYFEARNVVGSAYQLPQITEVDLQDGRTEEGLVPVARVQNSKDLVTFSEYGVRIPLDKWVEFETNVKLRQEYAKNLRKAINRRLDQMIIDEAIDNAGHTISDGGTNLTLEKLLDAKSILDTANVPFENRFVVLHSNSVRSLLNDNRLTSADYNTVKALVEGQINQFLGFTFKQIGDIKFRLGNNVVDGGLPKSGNIRSIFVLGKEETMFRAWQKVDGGNPEIDIYYVNEATTYYSQAVMKVGVKVAENRKNCIVKIECDETA